MTKKEVVFEDLKNKIINGEIKQGDWITEREISEIYKISRTPIREILWNLALLNIIESTGDRGYRVKKYNIEDIIEIFNARKAIDVECARLACFSIDPDYDKKIQVLLEELNKTDDKNTEQLVNIGTKIHEFIEKEAGNKYLSDFKNSIDYQVKVIRRSTKYYTNIEIESKKIHKIILESLQARDVNKCTYMMRKHLNDTCVAMVQKNCNNLLENNNINLLYSDDE